jgi:hypothetical protein
MKPNKPCVLPSYQIQQALIFPVYCRQKLGLVDGLSGRVFERSEFSTTPSIKFNFWIKGNIGCHFVWFVYFGHAK